MDRTYFKILKKDKKTQLIIANTFHLWDPALADKGGPRKKSGKTFLTRSFGLNIPTMTDSGGFQILSLAFGDKNKVGKILKPVDNRLAKSVIHITGRKTKASFGGRQGGRYV
ncbi:MAG: hypothetical protein AAB941_02735 [Patescibacteria group bacterium]